MLTFKKKCGYKQICSATAILMSSIVGNMIFFRCKKVFRLLFITIFLTSSNAVLAASILYDIEAYTLYSGGTLTGSLGYDAAINQLTDINLTYEEPGFASPAPLTLSLFNQTGYDDRLHYGPGTFYDIINSSGRLFGAISLQVAFSVTNTGLIGFLPDVYQGHIYPSTIIYMASPNNPIIASRSSVSEHNIGSVPEPATIEIIGLGFVGMGYMCRRKVQA